jgi:hypothetical protein
MPRNGRDQHRESYSQNTNGLEKKDREPAVSSATTITDPQQSGLPYVAKLIIGLVSGLLCSLSLTWLWGYVSCMEAKRK